MLLAGFFTDAQGKLAKVFKTAADSLRDSFRFAHTTTEAVLTEFGYSELVFILHCFVGSEFTVNKMHL